jgi:hypothetical protein
VMSGTLIVRCPCVMLDFVGLAKRYLTYS